MEAPQGGIIMPTNNRDTKIVTPSIPPPSNDNPMANYRLFQLISPALPIGSFTYSQGLEWAVETGWVHDQNSLLKWLTHMGNNTMVTLELPLLRLMYQAVSNMDTNAMAHYSTLLYCNRETRELRLEETNRGQAFLTLLKNLNVPNSDILQAMPHKTQLLPFALAGYYWDIPLSDLQQGHLWAWAETLVTAGIKLLPLGQTAGQHVLMHMTEMFPDMITQSNTIPMDRVGSFTPLASIASSLHETQYSRLFRS